jgi:putative hydrolase of the HAD superfamily
MAHIKAVIFDFIGTLTKLIGYSVEAADRKLFNSLTQDGYNMSMDDFLVAYERANERNSEIRYRRLVEVTNAVWVSEALNYLGFDTKPDDEAVKTAVNVFFKDYLYGLRLRPSVKTTLQKLILEYKVGLISNFTYAPIIYAALRKLSINQFFNVVLVSNTVGYRKPHPKIFRRALNVLRVKPCEAVFVGDRFVEDIQGAKNVGMKTVFIPSQFNNVKDVEKTEQTPDYIITNVHDILRALYTYQSEARKLIS